MPLIISSAARERARETHKRAPVVHLWHIVADVQTSATSVFQLCPYPTALHHGGKTYDPMPMSWNGFEIDAEANLPRTTVRIDNTRRFLAPSLHQGDGFIGRRVTLTEISLDLLGSTDPHDALVAEFSITTAGIDDRWVTLNMALPDLYIRQIPEQRYNPGQCRFRFGLPGGGCPYPLGPRAVYSTCSKLLDACAARGMDMVARGYPKVLPRRFGAFPGSALR